MNHFHAESATDATTSTPTSASHGVVLHPNLARIAVRYQELVDAYARREVDATEASLRMRELVARDDDGVQWTVNPRDGGWLRCTVWGEWVPGEPPRQGFATLTAWELSGRQGADRALTFTAQEAAPVVGYRGMTRAMAEQKQKAALRERPRWVYPLLLVGVAALVLVVVLAKMDDGQQVSSASTIPASAYTGG